MRKTFTDLNLQIQKIARLVSSFRGQKVEMFAPSSFCQLCRFQDIISIYTNKSLLRENRNKLFPKSCEFILKITTQPGWQARKSDGGKGVIESNKMHRSNAWMLVLDLGKGSKCGLQDRLPALAARPDHNEKPKPVGELSFFSFQTIK